METMIINFIPEPYKTKIMEKNGWKTIEDVDDLQAVFDWEEMAEEDGTIHEWTDEDYERMNR